MEMHLWFFSYYYYFSFLEVERRNANQILVEVYLRASTIYRYNCFLSQQQYCSASSAETRIVLSEALLSRVRSPTAIVWYCSIVGWLCIMCINLLHPIQSSLLRALSTWTSRNLQGKSFYNLSQCIIILVVGGVKNPISSWKLPCFKLWVLCVILPLNLFSEGSIESVQSCLFSRLNKAVFFRLFIQALCSNPMTILMASGRLFVVFQL